MTSASGASRRRGEDPFPSFLTWSICHEFLRVVTNRRVLRSPWGPQDSWRFIETLLASPGFELLHAHGTPPESAGTDLVGVAGCPGKFGPKPSYGGVDEGAWRQPDLYPRYRFSSVPVPDGSGSAAVAGRRGSAPSAPRTGLKPVPTAMRAPGGWKCLRVICRTDTPPPAGDKPPRYIPLTFTPQLAHSWEQVATYE